jgi:hypothetical protein
VVIKGKKMKHELKITMTYETEDENESAPILNTSVRVCIDGDIIGCIQDLSFHANHKELEPKLEITFPNIKSLDADWTAYQFNNPSYRVDSCFERDIKRYVEMFSKASNVVVKTQEIDDGSSNVVMLTEVGTDGNIDSFPMKRRHK